MSARAPESPLLGVIRAVSTALATRRRAVLVAPPGTGKTTRVPLALIDEPWLGGQRILMLEPRRIAARSAAEYMSTLTGDRVGGVVGYRTRGDSKVGPGTRIEVVTERLLTRRLQRDPALDGVGLVIFDEVHERSIDTDLGLALALDVATGLRDDLRVLAMSATPDIDAIAGVLGDDDGPATVIVSDGVAHPITTTYVGRDHRRRLDDDVADAVLLALRASEGDVLVFLPGRREIRFTTERLAARGIDAIPLTAGLDRAALDRALRPDADGKRKVILATSVAQTSLTIDGVRVVVDAGLERSARFDPARAMSGLVTVPVSQAAADQRRGRAGRQGPGRCYRLWHEAEQHTRRAHSEPEIDTADLTALALDVAAWGVGAPSDLRWISAPPSAAWSAAKATLRSIGAVGDDGRITTDGRVIADLGAHPRLGRLMVDSARAAASDDGALLAAVIEAGVRGDLRRALDSPDRDVVRVADGWRRSLRRIDPVAGSAAQHGTGDEQVGALVAAAFPERVARRRDGSRTRFLMASGVGVSLVESSPLAGAEWLAIAEVERVDGGDQRVLAAAPLSGRPLEQLLAARTERRAQLVADRAGTLTARSTRNLGAIVIGVDTDVAPDRVAVVGAAATLLWDKGIGLLDWSDAARELQQRAGFARLVDDRVPDASDAGLVDTAGDWLGSFLPTGTTIALGRVAAADVLASVIGGHRTRIDDLAPSHLTAPSGRRHRIEYGHDGPVVRVKLQEMFGAPTSPRIGGVPITLHLLSPAGRPLQVTQDLASFWAGAYAQVRSEMRGRYPRHPWPDDPTAAVPTASVKHPRKR